MLIFGHVGITLGMIKTYEGALKEEYTNDSFIDYRIVVLGSLLPDIIDKPLVYFIYGLETHRGHFIAHSFVVSVLFILLGIIIFLERNHKIIFLLGVYSLIHQVLDNVILLPGVLFSSSFIGKGSFLVPKHLSFVHYLTLPIYKTLPYTKGIKRYFLEPPVFLSEILGLIIVVFYLQKLSRSKGYSKFLKNGRL